jgi:ribosome biogenesis GTPase
VGEGSEDEVLVTCTKGSELRNQAIVTGDRVDIVGDVSGDAGSLARIVRVHQRSTVLRRSGDDTDTIERVIVANADQLLMVVAAANPEPRPRLIDRYIIAALDAGITPLLVVTKTDLADPRALLDYADALDIACFTRSPDQPATAELLSALAEHVTVAVGHSGVGKSTLVNDLVPGADRAVGDVNEVTGRGRHTSSSSQALRLEGGGWIVDTPGVRSFGLGHVSTDSIIGGFPELAELVASCPKACQHTAHTPECSLTRAVQAGDLAADAAARIESLQRLMATVSETGFGSDEAR